MKQPITAAISSSDLSTASSTACPQKNVWCDRLKHDPFFPIGMNHPFVAIGMNCARTLFRGVSRAGKYAWAEMPNGKQFALN
eukprot:3117639-Rhodomonas_salina.2